MGWYFPTNGFLYLGCLAHVLLSPWTKVEESFNLQATRDLLYLGPKNVSDFDHRSFSGVVPRTFLGPLYLFFCSYPIFSLVTRESPFLTQILVRSVLGFSVMSCLIRFRASVRRKFGSVTSNFHLLITLSQFHFMYYSSRPLPNTFAMGLVLLALAYWLDTQYFKFMFLSGFVVLVFRFELAIYLGLIVLMDLAVQRVSFLKVVLYGLITSVLSLATTIAVDSFFWKDLDSPLWPEGDVLRFNLIENRSSEYGTSPFWWYFYSALPRALFATLPFVVLGAIKNKRTLVLVFPALLFVFIYSFLPHKELRFIMYVIPVLNVAAAEALWAIWRARNRSWIKYLITIAAISHIILNLGFTVGMTFVSRLNYPGGEAMAQFHELVPSSKEDVRLYINNLAAQTGVSKFTQLNDGPWVYDKTENVADFSSFTHLILEPGEFEDSDYVGEHFRRIAVIKSFSGVEYDYKSWSPFVSIKTKPALYILEQI